MSEDESPPTDPEAFDVTEREPMDWEPEEDGWFAMVRSLLLTYLNPEDQTEHEAEKRTDVLAYGGRGRLGDLFPVADQAASPGEITPLTEQENHNLAALRISTGKPASQIADEKVTLWYMRRADRDSIEFDHSGWDDDDPSFEEVHRGIYVLKDGPMSLFWLMTAGQLIEKIQVGVEDQSPETLRPELVELLRKAAQRGPFIRYVREDGPPLNPTEEICRQLLCAANEIEGGAQRTQLWHGTPVEELQQDQADAPAPRPSPIPFDSATGVATFPTDPATRGNLRGISGEGEWVEDSFGRPVYSYTIEGPPWGGDAQLSVKGAIEAETAWKMLRDGKGEDRPAQFHADAVALYLLFLAYAGDQAPENRPGENGEFRIRGKDAFRILNLPAGWDLQKKVRHVYNLNRYLNSFQIQLKRVTYEGQKKRTDAISPAQLWDTYLRGVQEEDLHGNVTNIEFWIEGEEGAWANLFVHGKEWTPWGGLPIRMLEEMDGRNRFNRLILFRVWVLFRVEKGTVKRTGDHLLKWCRVVPDELSRQTIYRRRSAIMNALEEIKQKGFRIDDSRLRAAQGAPLEDWQGQPVYFYPPEEIVEACPQVHAPKGELPEPRSDVWTGKRVRALRKHIGDTQGEFGKRLPNRSGEMGVKQPRISTIENGPHNLTSRQEEKLDELAEQFGFDG